MLADTSDILYFVTFALGLQLVSNNFWWGHDDETSLAVRELVEYMVNTCTSLLSVVFMVINLWSSDVTGEDVSHLLWIYLFCLAARGRVHRASDRTPAPAVILIAPTPAVIATLLPVVGYIASAPVMIAAPAPVLDSIATIPRWSQNLRRWRSTSQ